MLVREILCLNVVSNAMAGFNEIWDRGAVAPNLLKKNNSKDLDSGKMRHT